AYHGKPGAGCGDGSAFREAGLQPLGSAHAPQSARPPSGAFAKPFGYQRRQLHADQPMCALEPDKQTPPAQRRRNASALTPPAAAPLQRRSGKPRRSTPRDGPHVESTLASLLSVLRSAAEGNFAVRLPEQGGLSGEVFAAFNSLVERNERLVRE